MGSNQDLSKRLDAVQVTLAPQKMKPIFYYFETPIIKLVPVTKSKLSRANRDWKKLIRGSKPSRNRCTISAQASWLNDIKRSRAIKRRDQHRTTQTN